MTDIEGQVRWEGVNSAWGKLLRESDTQLSGYSQNLRMQGQYLDRETGLHYNLFRYYDPDCGRFTQQDPIGLAGGLNLYAYAPNPLSWIDPLGLKCGGINRRQALNKAKDTAGIPRSQQPDRQWIVGNNKKRIGRTNYKYSDDLTSHGRYYEYTDTYGHKKVIVEHTSDPRAPRPHTHAGKSKLGADPRTYDFKENRYQKIIVPSTDDHHIYYDQ